MYEQNDLKLCLIMTEERLLIIDAVEKTMIRDFTADILCSIETKPVYKKQIVKVNKEVIDSAQDTN
jgi:hypothetical protein